MVINVFFLSQSLTKSLHLSKQINRRITQRQQQQKQTVSQSVSQREKKDKQLIFIEQANHEIVMYLVNNNFSIRNNPPPIESVRG